MDKKKSAIQRYNEKTYTKLAIAVEKPRLKEFREKCKKENISQRSVIIKAIDEFLKGK